MENRISVVIPTYNRAQTLSRPINSVISQSYENWELFIVDDGSTDDTQKLIQEKYSDDQRIHFLKRPESRSKGANACRNIGIEKATGEYVALLDSDDAWGRKHLENCYKYAESTSNFAGSYSSATVKKGFFPIKKKSRSINSDESLFDFLLSAFVQTSTFFLKTERAKQIKFNESLQRHQDWDFFIRFGEAFKWHFNPSVEVVVHRDIQNSIQRLDYKSYASFYETHGDKLTQESLKKKYLLDRYKKAVIIKDDFGKEYFKRILMERGWGEIIDKQNSVVDRAILKVKHTYLMNFVKSMLKALLSIFEPKTRL